MEPHTQMPEGKKNTNSATYIDNSMCLAASSTAAHSSLQHRPIHTNEKVESAADEM